MRKLNITIIVAILLFANCKRLPKGYIKYQTFDEFSLKGINFKDSIIKEPFVGVKEENKVISVIICERFKKRILLKYYEKGDYWYNLRKEQLPYFPGVKNDTTPHYIERFLYNDTIMEYSYYLKNGKTKFLEELNFETRKNIIELSDSAGFQVYEKDRFQQLKRFIVNYTLNYTPYEPEFQKRCYQYYCKYRNKDTLFISDIVGNKISKPGSYQDIRKLNSLGEFDPNKGKSILDDVLQINKFSKKK